MNDLLEQLQGLWGGGSSTGSASSIGSGGASSGLGFNLGTGQLALQGLGALGNLWNANKANKMAADQFKFAKGITNTNINNSIQAYNTALADRYRARGITEGTSEADVAAQIERNRLTR